MEKLTGKEIVAIIRAGKDAGLVKFELGDLKIEFISTKDDTSAATPQQLNFPQSTSTEIERTFDKTTLQTMTQELDRDLLMITNPQAYEEQLLLGDASDEKA